MKRRLAVGVATGARLASWNPRKKNGSLPLRSEMDALRPPRFPKVRSLGKRGELVSHFSPASLPAAAGIDMLILPAVQVPLGPVGAEPAVKVALLYVPCPASPGHRVLAIAGIPAIKAAEIATTHTFFKLTPHSPVIFPTYSPTTGRR